MSLCIVCEGGDDGFVCDECFHERLVTFVCINCYRRAQFTVEYINKKVIDTEIIYFSGMIIRYDSGCPFCTDDEEVWGDATMFFNGHEYDN